MRVLVGLVLSLAAAACTFRPVPLVAQAGTTIVVPVAGEAMQGRWIGYESDTSRAAGIHDDQRGGIVFVLVDDALAPTVEHELVTRFVTRAVPDPATFAALGNGRDMMDLAQVVAVVDVPATTPPGDYVLVLRRVRRVAATGTAEEELPSIVQSFPSLRVLPVDVDPTSGEPRTRFTPVEALFAGRPFGSAADELYKLFPFPKAVLELGTPGAAAVSVEVDFPPDKLSVLSVVEEGHAGQGSIVRWSEPATGRLRIELVDPDAGVPALAIAFEPLDPFGSGRPEVADFRVTRMRAYDRGGRALAIGAAVTEIR
jgi:hypothetical protein